MKINHISIIRIEPSQNKMVAICEYYTGHKFAFCGKPAAVIVAHADAAFALCQEHAQAVVFKELFEEEAAP